MADEEFSFPTYMGDTIRVRVARFGMPAVTHEQRVRSEKAFREMRLAVEWNSEPVVFMAQRIHHALHQVEPVFRPRERMPDPFTIAYFEELMADLEADFELGRLTVTEGAIPLLGIPPDDELVKRKEGPRGEPPLPSIARPAPPDRLTLFEVRFVDEIGQGIGGLEVEITAGGLVEKLTTNPAGVALIEDVVSMSASVRVVTTTALGNILFPRWETERPSSLPGGVNTTVLTFDEGGIGPVALKPAVPNTVAIKPPVTTFFEVCFVDELGEPISGLAVRFTASEEQVVNTDGNGVARLNKQTTSVAEVQVDDVQALRDIMKPRWDQPREGEVVDAGEETTLLFLEGDELEALSLKSETPHTISIQPYVLLARLIGMFFDTNKNFVLPSAVPSLKEIPKLYERHPESKLLLVGHTDTSGEASINDPLSLERAESMAAYLTDNVDAWLARYASSVPVSKRWGSAEDQHMLNAELVSVDSIMIDEAFLEPKEREDEDPLVKVYQRLHNALPEQRRSESFAELSVDGILGPDTRRQLIGDYMNKDGTTLPRGIDLELHGCGENFPLEESGEELDTTPEDELRDQTDRRVEFFFFDAKLGVLPKPPGKNSKPGSQEYPTWRRRAREHQDFVLFTRTLRLFLLDEEYQRMPDTEYELRVANRVRRGRSDANGLLVEPDIAVPGLCEVRWSRGPDGPGPDPDLAPPERYPELKERFRFRTELELTFKEEVAEPQLEAEADLRLINMGYVTGEFTPRYQQFREHYELDAEQPFDRAGFDELARVHRDGVEAPPTNPELLGSEGESQEFEDEAGLVLPIEVQLLTEDGSPAGGQAFEIRRAGETLRNGTLDARGRATVTDLDLGDYTVTFPNLDEESWDEVVEETNG